MNILLSDVQSLTFNAPESIANAEGNGNGFHSLMQKKLDGGSINDGQVTDNKGLSLAASAFVSLPDLTNSPSFFRKAVRSLACA